jgi:hypothetical protein
LLSIFLNVIARGLTASSIQTSIDLLIPSCWWNRLLIVLLSIGGVFKSMSESRSTSVYSSTVTLKIFEIFLKQLRLLRTLASKVIRVYGCRRLRIKASSYNIGLWISCLNIAYWWGCLLLMWKSLFCHLLTHLLSIGDTSIFGYWEWIAWRLSWTLIQVVILIMWKSCQGILGEILFWIHNCFWNYLLVKFLNLKF